MTRSDAIKIFEKGSDEYNILLSFAAKANKILATYGVYLKVETMYFCFALDWKWTTLVAFNSQGDSWDALMAPEQEDILNERNEAEVMKSILDFTKERTNQQRTKLMYEQFGVYYD